MTIIEPVIISSAWVHCQTPFGFDSYTGCDFGCAYCFMNFKRRNWRPLNPEPSPFKRIKAIITREGLPPDKGQWQKFKWAFDNITYKLGVRNDPFPYNEPEYLSTYNCMKLFSGKPLLVLTKNPEGITDKYLDLGVNLAVGVSISSPNNELEANTPDFKNRLKYALRLARKGIPIHVRITPTKGDWWTQETLDELFDVPWYVATYDNCTELKGNRNVNVLGIKDSSELERCNEKILSAAERNNIKLRFTNEMQKPDGEYSCLPKGFPYWKGTFWEKTPEIPKEAIMYPRSDKILVQKLRAEGMSYIHMNHILHLYAKGRVQFAGLDENWDKKGVNLYEADYVNFPKVLF